MLPASQSRRTLLQILSGAGAWVACRPPREPILPYTFQPEEVTPGRPNHYATSLEEDGYAVGLLVESYEGRPTRIDGNPEHPASLGAATPAQQAAILDLYDPSRIAGVSHRNEPSGWEPFARAFSAPSTGEGLHFLLPGTGSPLLRELMGLVLARHPGARFHFWDPFSRGNSLQGALLATGRPLTSLPNVEAAQTIACFDADLLASMPFSPAHARHFAKGRRPEENGGAMKRLYVVEGDLTVTGTNADHRLAVKPSEVSRVLAAVAASILGLQAPPLDEKQARFARALARDLRARPSTVVVGERQPPQAHALALTLNQLLGVAPRLLEPSILAVPNLEPLESALDRGEVSTLVIWELDPVRMRPGFAERLAGLPLLVTASTRLHATAQRATWRLAANHFLESWGDSRALDGTITFRQPLIRPLREGRSLPELLAYFAGEPRPDGHGLLRRHWEARIGRGALDRGIRLGLLQGSASPPQQATFSESTVRDAVAALGARPPAPPLELSLFRDPKIGDGHNPWLLELPDPVTRISWSNPALVSPATFASLATEWAELEAAGRKLRVPLHPQPGIADGVVSLALGWRDQEEGGVDAWPLAGHGFVHEISLLPTARMPEPILVQPHQQMPDDRGPQIYQHMTLDELRTRPAAHQEDPPSLYPDAFEETGDQWGMAVDLSSCIGCGACVIACQAENNIPVVGAPSVRKAREMHWIRIDRYLASQDDFGTLELLPQPMLCQHCEKAPCEYVCPVNATVHSPDGLNEMVYNRCVGTRFCSNNCPYKVRRFNYLEYNADEGPLTLQKNPQVSVRARGVMEKCTFCVQRIRRTQIDARLQSRSVGPDEVHTACQDACPTEAIVFGLVSDPSSRVSRRIASGRSFQALQELGTRPRVHYQARIRNPNPELLT